MNFRWLWISGLAGALACGAGCGAKKSAAPKAEESTVASKNQTHGLTPQQAAQELVRIGGHSITVGEFAQALNDQSPYLRARYNSPERKREFLDHMIEFELLAMAAKAQGYDQNPEIQQTRKQLMIQEMLSQDFKEHVRMSDIRDAEIKAYYDSHRAEFEKPQQVRASHILIKDAQKAKAVLEKALATKTTENSFEKLAEQVSEDSTTRARGGDLFYFAHPSSQKANQAIAKEVALAAFALKEIGDIATEPVATKDGFHILKLTGKREPLAYSLADARGIIQNHLWRERRDRYVNNVVEKLRKEAKITRNLAVLQHLKLPNAPHAP